MLPAVQSPLVALHLVAFGLASVGPVMVAVDSRQHALRPRTKMTCCTAWPSGAFAGSPCRRGFGLLTGWNREWRSTMTLLTSAMLRAVRVARVRACWCAEWVFTMACYGAWLALVAPLAMPTGHGGTDSAGVLAGRNEPAVSLPAADDRRKTCSPSDPELVSRKSVVNAPMNCCDFVHVPLLWFYGEGVHFWGAGLLLVGRGICYVARKAIVGRKVGNRHVVPPNCGLRRLWTAGLGAPDAHRCRDTDLCYQHCASNAMTLGLSPVATLLLLAGCWRC